ncbi:unnamed protein product [Kuraishia capsulata CBS 1993]|uniref:Large ribosomal subunit protein uL29m n=1 Tax=Kuraishia capsulata CBS 1993 TaxID=1382522 RepID=W6MSW7_9ASCO|nr:uncharacterized protein KUCA_T00004299001 [Kuraishia capsulata CBS 1993]CDK28317.1 unnamed protein product [Kuraishia capsulata CBS 1993]
MLARIQRSGFHTSSVANAKVRVALQTKLRKPIIPTLNNLKVPDDHPLWQFFSEKKFIRDSNEVRSTGRSWSVQELRRKSFEDLHKLWYVCLKESNIILREKHLLDGIRSQSSSLYEDQEGVVRKSMINIRHVLTERYRAFENTQSSLEDGNARLEYLEEFRERYNEADNVDTQDWFDRLDRFQSAVFGIPVVLDDSIKVDEKYLEGIRYLAELKYHRFQKEVGKDLGELRDIAEMYAVFEESPNAAGVARACEKIVEYREASDFTIEKSKEIAIVEEFIRDRIAQYEEETQ